jgi:stringent starvation protein B
MPTTQPLPPKKEVALALLERSNDRGIYVHLDPRRAGVTVPPWFKKQPQLVLQIGLNMAIPIPDLRLDDDGMRCTLSFSGSPFYCVVPWSVVFAIVGDDARGMVWPDDVPVEVSRQAAPPRAVEAPARKEGWKPEPAGEAKAEGAAKTKKPRKRPALAAVADEQAPPAPSSKPAKPARAPQPVQAAPPRPVVPPATPSRPAVGAARKKRELPPYLRVVK